MSLKSSRISMVAIGRRCTQSSARLVDHDDKFQLTKQELDAVSQFPLFKEIERGQPAIKAEKLKYLSKKLPIVSKLFNAEEEPDFLSFKLPRGLQSPYHHAYARRPIDPRDDAASGSRKNRLSVTKLLTKRWCELREAYDIYSRIPLYEHAQLKVGKKEHQRLEDETHQVPLDYIQFKEDYNLEIPDDPFHTLVEDWFLSITKILDLFENGHARELLCHCYLDSRTGELLCTPARDENDILVSGIIDHLVLTNEEGTVTLPGHHRDLKHIYSELALKIQAMKGKAHIIVSDVKTRPTPSIPRQSSVIKYSKFQVMYYRRFLETLSLDSDQTYRKLLINAQRRGFDVSAPIDPTKILSLLEMDQVFVADMERLQQGKPIGFNSFDDEPTGQPYLMDHLDETVSDLRIKQRYGHLFTTWEQPVTLKYFAARLAQAYTLLGPLLSDKLSIEYYCRGHNFQSVNFEYDWPALKNQIKDSSMFWFGKRDIDPISPTVQNFVTYCRFCDYEDVCLWNKKGKAMCRTLGPRLVEILEEAKPR
ncbi:LAMI_0E06678g1_1 [Lachancea mirantina]|uniref:Exonuclease V, mitochondrial n=1 Tax=Lachancea mirantina TaxID=1230905 RepID=A0A1G4JM01_9SACH|nr:LAMI_0E06678g1_1 [Lachancea mirantina]